MAGRRLFCFALQSRLRRRKKVAARPLREGDRGAARTLRPDQVIKERDGSAWSRQEEGDRAALWDIQPRGLRWHSLGRIGVIPIDFTAGEKEVATPASCVGACAPGVAGKDVMVG
jgi:hypothetical protein